MIKLYRVDDRLVHGQVVEGWLPYVKADEIAVVSDEIASDGLRVNIMNFATPENVNLKIFTLKDAVAYMSEAENNPRNVMVLFPGLNEAEVMFENGVKMGTLNIGGMLYTACRNLSVGQAVFLNDNDKKIIKKLFAGGVKMDVRGVPSDNSLNLGALVEKE